MWVLVVCFCLFLSGLYLYIIIYKAVSVLQIAVLRIADIRQVQICMLHQRVTQHAGSGHANEQTRHKQSTESAGYHIYLIQANYRSSYCCGTSAAAARALELAQAAKSP